MRKIIYDRLNGGESVRRQDILQILIDSQKSVHKEDRLTVDAIAQETVLFLIVGSETTSATLGFILIQLLRNPDKLALLREEIDALPLQGKMFAHEQLKNLPYLNGVIHEGLRMDPIVAVGVERQTYKDTTLGGQLFLPKGVCKHICFHVTVCAYYLLSFFFRTLDGCSLQCESRASQPTILARATQIQA